SVMNWSPYKPITYNGETYGLKDVECQKFIDLPGLTNQKMELAMSGGIKPKELVDHGWKLVSGIAKVRRDMWAYQRYIQRSRAEWSVAKNLYVDTKCGWFSERSACYLASGKPVLVQDTGFSKYIPTGKGLLEFNDMDGILKGIDEINDDYVSHCEAARQIAEKYFDSDIVLKDLLRKAGM
ncbi:glycosyltransferase family 1 protein, partial [bacterium]|nr:glycosyltransferase family 1 protein [bacterium]